MDNSKIDKTHLSKNKWGKYVSKILDIHSEVLEKLDMKENHHHHDDDASSHALTSIICINVSENKFYVYSENGLLLNRVNFSETIVKYGHIVAISNNGLTLVLKKRYEDIIN